MTYTGTKEQSATLLEISKSTTQTVSSGDIVLWDTIRATGTHGVTVNSSTGEITLDTSKHYHLRCSLDVQRSSYSDMRFAFVDSAGNIISAEEGGYDANLFENGQRTFTMVAVYQTHSPISPIRLKAVTVGANSTIQTSMSIFALEVTP